MLEMKLGGSEVFGSCGSFYNGIKEGGHIYGKRDSEREVTKRNYVIGDIVTLCIDQFYF